MEIAFTVSVTRVGQSNFGWRLYWNQEANVVAVEEVLVDGPLRPGDIIRSVNGADTVSEILQCICYEQGPMQLQIERFEVAPSTAPVLAGAKLLAAQLLREEGTRVRPTEFSLRETANYLGLYFYLDDVPTFRRLGVHITIAHWRDPVIVLGDKYKARIVKRAIEGLGRGQFHFSGSPPIDLGRRVLVTLDVRCRQHATMYILAQMATQFFESMRCRATPSWRQNFHLSIDNIYEL